MSDRKTILRGSGAIIAICAVGLAFIGSYVGALHDPKPHQVPVSVVGPPSLISEIGKGGAFDPRPTASAAAAAKAIDERKTYASFIATPRSLEVITAPAAGASVADAIDSYLVPALQHAGANVKVSQVHPLNAQDTRGLAGFYLAVGWIVAGYLGATFLGLLFSPKPGFVNTKMRLAGLAALGIAIGLVGTSLVHLIGAVDGSFIATAATGVLTVFAVGSAAVALQSALGIFGTISAILIFVVLGNPSSTGPIANEMLPGFWRAIGSYIPNGATVQTLRNIDYFPNANSFGHIIVLVVWALVGTTVALALGSRNERFKRAEAQIAEGVSSLAEHRADLVTAASAQASGTRC